MSRRSIGSTRVSLLGSNPVKAQPRRAPQTLPPPRRGAVFGISAGGGYRMKYAMLVLKNLMRNKRRTILTVLSIAVSLFIFSALVSMPAVVNQFLADSASADRIACHNKAGVNYSIPEAYRQRVVAAPHVAAVTAQSWFGGLYHEVSDQFPNMAVDPEMVGQMWPDWDISPQALHEFQRVRTGALVGP